MVAMYSPAIMNVMGTGDLTKMKEVAAEAERLLQSREVRGFEAGEPDPEEGDIEGALTALKAEIAKIEGT